MSGSRRLSLSLVAALGLGVAAAAQAPVEAPATVTAAGLRALVDAHEGKVVVVNFWATWCPPCKAEFPDIIRVHDDLHAAGLEVIAVSMNADDELDDVDAFLREFEPPFPVYRAVTQDETFYEGVVEMIGTGDWFGELPITLVFDAAGNPVRYHRKPVTYDEVVADVTALLPASAR